MVCNLRIGTGLSLIALLLASCSVQATSIVLVNIPVITDKALIEWASDIIEGEVVDVVQKKDRRLGDCYYYIYKLRISDIVKSNHKIGDEIDVGLVNYSSEIKIGQKQFIILGKPKSGFYSGCESKNLKSITEYDNIKIDDGTKVSLYIVESKLDEKEIFYSMRCSNDELFLENSEGLYTKVSAFKGEGFECDVYKGDYNLLRAEVESLIENLKEGQGR